MFNVRENHSLILRTNLGNQGGTVLPKEWAPREPFLNRDTLISYFLCSISTFTTPHLCFDPLACCGEMIGTLDNFYCSVECLSL